MTSRLTLWAFAVALTLMLAIRLVQYIDCWPCVAVSGFQPVVMP